MTSAPTSRPTPRPAGRPVRAPRGPASRTDLSNRLAVVGLLVLAAVPVLAGAVRLGDLGEATADNARFVADPVPIMVHVVAATLYAVLGALQFSRRIRRDHHAWHRRAGVVLVPTGVLVATSGLWMTAAYDVPAGDDGALAVMRYAVGAAMLVQLALAVVALTRHRYAAHGAWMTRAYALAMGAGTQVLTGGPTLALTDPPDWVRPVSMGAGWALNILVAEWVVARRRRRP
jgi:cytochrome bd-type quinol oxidase subunit 2